MQDRREWNEVGPQMGQLSPELRALLELMAQRYGLIQLNDLLKRANKTVADLPKLAGDTGRRTETQ